MLSRPESQINRVPHLKTFLPRKAVSAAREPHVDGQAFGRLLEGKPVLAAALGQ